ncbi:ferritin-like domain-containing protein [Nocardia sp. NPDC005978]|uniref:ferritin-like domain-containing protein n=1 Tax=Nocardia sp. NPDC005978 TaxID=3156725 RepID=UPI0033AD29C9
MNTRDTSLLRAQLRSVRALTNTEIQIAETRTGQARTEAVREELATNAANARARAEAIGSAERELGGVPEVIGPFLGKATAVVKTLREQAQPFDEALLGDLALEHQLLDRARYIKALATNAREPQVVALADRLIKAHSATVSWLGTVLAEEALGGPAALRRTPFQAVTGTAVKLANLPVTWSTRGIDRTLDAFRSAPPALNELLSRGAHVGDVAVKSLGASRDAVLESVEEVTRREGETRAADSVHAARTATGVLHPAELPIRRFDELNVTQASAKLKELTEPSDIRAVLAYEEANKNRHGVVAAAENRLAAIAQDVAGLN